MNCRNKKVGVFNVTTNQLKSPYRSHWSV